MAPLPTASAAQLAVCVGKGKLSHVPKRRDLSSYFTYFEDDTRFVMICDDSEARGADHGLAYGMTWRGDKRLVLVLPERYAFPTLQRVPWFTTATRPEVWLHDGKTANLAPAVTPKDTIDELTKRLKPGQSLGDELHDAATPKHLGDKSEAVDDLVEWATKHKDLDASHRRGERAWQFMGRKVLAITGGGSGVKAGIDYKHVDDDSALLPIPIPTTGKIDGAVCTQAQEYVEKAIAVRLKDKAGDEHWLQAVIRRDPSLVGVEQPAIRELPAWRPASPSKGGVQKWGRGYLDLIGVDGHGDIRLIETKLEKNPDDFLILQGLDYYVWARAYEQVIRTRLSAPDRARLKLHYVIGAKAGKDVHLSPYAAAQAEALDTKEVDWRFQVVCDWFQDPRERSRAWTYMHDPHVLP
jgi:hypothetical protein